MKIQGSIKKLVRESAGRGFLLIIVAVLTLEATALIQYYYTRAGMRQEAEMRAEGQLETSQVQILSIIRQAEAAVHNNVWIASWCLDNTDSLGSLVRRIVADNPEITGSTIALTPRYDKPQPLLAPYAYRKDGEILLKSLATPEYDYPSQEWFTEPMRTGEGYWSEPYIDTGGGEVLMTTYSVPLRDHSGRIMAVLTADISLEWLSDLMEHAQIYPNSFGVVLSRSGRIMVSPAKDLDMNMTVQEYSEQRAGDKVVFDSLSRAMISGESGNIAINSGGKVLQVFFAPVEHTGWAMSIAVPEEEIFAGLRRVGIVVKILQLFGLALLIFIFSSLVRNQLRYMQANESRERMEGELQIARNIQMAMVPRVFPERKDLDMAASLIPAKEVGGDLYDFFIRDEKLFFCIGDVSGKGVPASLVMAVTRSQFRAFSAHVDSPAKIVTAMNDSLSEMNENEMFVTLFCGVLDLAAGHLKYCNAGHNPPVILTSTIQTLPVEPNLPLGIMGGMPFKEQETAFPYDSAIFLYTDGLTEAENLGHDQFGEGRMEKILHGRKEASAHLQNMADAVHAFVGEAPQSDDLTMLFIHYLGGKSESIGSDHLILHNNISQITALGEWMETIGEKYGIDMPTLSSLNLALEEAATNVIMYAYPDGAYGSVELSCDSENGALRFTLTDTGKPFDPTARPEVDINAGVEERAIGGLGIHLVKNIMDSVSYSREDGKNLLTMIKNI